MISSPVNLIFSELLLCQKEKLLHSDDSFKRLLFNILSHYSDYCEYFFRYEWVDITKKKNVESKKVIRKRIDKFLWRIQNRLSSLVDYSQVSINCMRYSI